VRRARWPDSAPALHDLRKSFTVVALSNGDLAQLAHFSAAGGLSWHCGVAPSMVRSAKPDPAVYQLVIDTLQLDPERALFVACHPWDLRAAALQGFRTAYVHRPGEAVPTESDRFDLIATDLADLVHQLIR
jgi:2-haloacid dehalogenase